jgi:hypothetical protein
MRLKLAASLALRQRAQFATGTSADITIDPNQYLSSLNFGAMGAWPTYT